MSRADIIRKTRGFAWVPPSRLHEKDVTVKHEIQELARRPCSAPPVYAVDEAALYAAVSRRNAERKVVARGVALGY